MGFISGIQADVGNVKKSNQDSTILKVAHSKTAGPILFAAVCDGMGGLAKGELASATVVRELDNWFETVLPNIIEKNRLSFETIRSEWVNIIGKVSNKISRYGAANNLSLGTTLVGALCVGSNMYIVNVGDSRLYKISTKLERLTTDHSLVAREIAAGRLRPEDEEKDPRRNVLLQCIGASKEIKPEIKAVKYQPGDVFLLCSDGFRHELKDEEMINFLYTSNLNSDKAIDDQLRVMIDLDKNRRETDNISAIAFKIV